MLRLVILLTGLAFGGLLAAPAGANTIVTFGLTAGSVVAGSVDGVINGTFSLDLTTHTVVDASISSTTGAQILGASYSGFSIDSFTTSATMTQLVFHNSATAVPGVAGQLLTLNMHTTDLSGFQMVTVFGNESVYFFLCGGLCASRPVGGFIETLSVTETPIPAALPLLATALGGMGLLGWRRKPPHLAATGA
ncbi:hypothetical protein [Dongia sp. agr-C8]